MRINKILWFLQVAFTKKGEINLYPYKICFISSFQHTLALNKQKRRHFQATHILTLITILLPVPRFDPHQPGGAVN
jgi:hypothetical protein